MRSALGVTIITLLLGAGPAAAQIAPASGQPSVNRNERKGFWIGFGFGDGIQSTACSTCSGSTEALSGYIKLGGTVSRHVLLGGEIDVWARTAGGSDQELTYGTGTLTWYPSATGAFFIKLGLGVMDYLETDGSGNKLEGAAGAAQVGLGYDWRVRRNLSITPFLNGLGSTDARFTVNGVGSSSTQRYKFNLIQFGVGLTWH